jgi:hypothetical protein
MGVFSSRVIAPVYSANLQQMRPLHSTDRILKTGLKCAVAMVSLFCLGVSCFAGEPIAPAHLFRLSPIPPQLPPEPKISTTNLVKKLPALPEEQDSHLELRYGMTPQASEQAFEAMNGSILTQVEPEPERAGAIGWVETKVLDPILVQESIKIGKVHLTGGIVTAIKRKNPLSLLNPFVLGLDW